MGFPINITPDERYKDAVAVVEVEVEKFEDPSGTAKPSITALLPKEKTYNVATITDKSTSIQGGMVTQVVGVSGSFLRGNKTYYLVQDQDTLAFTFKPRGPRSDNRVGFMWQFRPVLGSRFVKSGKRENFVQVAVPGLPDSTNYARISLKTYWRKYDRKKGIVEEVIPNSLNSRLTDWPVPKYLLAGPPSSFNVSHLEDLGDGQIRVRLDGRFLRGTYVRIGARTPNFDHDYSSIRFTASAYDLATKKVFLVAQDGTEVPLVMSHVMQSGANTPRPQITDTQVTTLDEENSLVTVELDNRHHVFNDNPPLLMIIGGKAYGYSDAPVLKNGDTLSVVVPTASLIANPEVTIKPVFAPDRYEDSDTLPGFTASSRGERLTLLEKNGTTITFLLNGSRLSSARVLIPTNVTLGYIGRPQDRDTMRTITLTSTHLSNNKFLVLQRQGERPFLIPLPPLEPKPVKSPEAKERVTVNAEEAIIEGDNMGELVSVKFRDTAVPFIPAKDGKSVTLTRLRSLGVTDTAATRTLELQFKKGKASVKLEIVSSKIETIPR